MSVKRFNKFRDGHGYTGEELYNFIQPKGAGLEIGCDEGRNLDYMVGKGLEVTGIDISREYLERVTPGIRVLRANALDLPFVEESFDWVLCTEVLEHLGEPQIAISEASRVLKHGATAVFACPTLDIPVKVLVPFYRKLLSISESSYSDHVQLFSTKRLMKMLSPQFEIEKIKYVDFLSLLQRRMNTGYKLETMVSWLSETVPLLSLFAGGTWSKVLRRG